MNINTVCNCPKCNHSGISLAAMHYKETQEWEKSGRFSGSVWCNWNFWCWCWWI